MRRSYLPMAIALSAMYMSIAACQGSDGTDKQTGAGLQSETAEEQQVVKQEHIPYQVAENYFVNNNVSDSVPAKIDSREVFDKYFGAAGTMGAGGQPTPIDFDKQYVIAVDYPTTTTRTEIIADSLVGKANKVVFAYTVRQGADLGFEIHPLLLLVVDKQYDGQLVFQKNAALPEE